MNVCYIVIGLVIYIGLRIHGRRLDSRWDSAIKDIRAKLDQGEE
jgi:hypothetical protein